MTEANLFYVYILAAGYRGYFYIGYTSNLPRRMIEHMNGLMPEAYTAQKNISDLVYYETFSTQNEALKREQQLKRFSRASKFKLVEKDNPNWQALQIEVLQTT